MLIVQNKLIPWHALRYLMLSLGLLLSSASSALAYDYDLKTSKEDSDLIHDDASYIDDFLKHNYDAEARAMAQGVMGKAYVYTQNPNKTNASELMTAVQEIYDAQERLRNLPYDPDCMPCNQGSVYKHPGLRANSGKLSDMLQRANKINDFWTRRRMTFSGWHYNIGGDCFFCNPDNSDH